MGLSWMASLTPGPGCSSRRNRPATVTAAPAAALMPNVQRHPLSAATVGTARPPRRIANGTADCFMPKARPLRRRGTSMAREMLDVTCSAALATPSTTKDATRLRHDVANQATPTLPPVATMPASMVLRRLPNRSATHPPSSAPMAAEPKNELTAIPKYASPKSRS